MYKSKCSRENQKAGSRKDRPKKRKQPCNKPELDDSSFISTSAKKLKAVDEIKVPEDPDIQHVIIDFFLVFTTLSTFVKCSNIIKEGDKEKVCNGKLKFSICKRHGLGFQIQIDCDACDPRYMLSSKKIGRSYAINRRFIFVMRILGLGLSGCEKFCGLMDISATFLDHSTYDHYILKIYDFVKIVAEKLFSLAAKQEREEMCLENDLENASNLIVSGDGTWKKRGFASLYGVASLIGHYSGKVLDICVKSSYCKLCETWKKKLNTVEFEDWHSEHIEKNECNANHIGPSGNMEVSAIIEMFKRSEQKHDVKYEYYIGDGDSKTYKGVIKEKPYGDNFEIRKKECIGHVQKRMGTRLRTLVKTTVEEKSTAKGKKIQKKLLSGKGKLTGKMIDKLTVYYGLAIRKHSNSVSEMQKAIWATYFHYSSTDDNPQHQNCPNGESSWCPYQRAAAKNELYKHNYASLPEDVLQAIKPIYEELSNNVLLERCVGGFTQNNNESLNQLIWKITPKNLPGGSKIVDIAANVAACVFNEGASALLLILSIMDLSIGREAHAYARKQDASRMLLAEKRAEASTKEERTRRRQEQKDALDHASAAGELLYGAGIDDSM